MRAWLKEKREALGRTQQQMAESLGVSQQYYSLIEKSERQADMTVPLLTKLSEILGVAVADIVRAESELSELTDTKEADGNAKAES